MSREEIDIRTMWLSEEERALLAALHGSADEDLLDVAGYRYL